jgi:FAD binding domain
MNCGLQDAFNLAWKLALVHQGVAHETLLDSYEIERRPAAELVTQSGDVTEHSLTMADPTERERRNLAIKAALSDAKTRHHEIVAETEQNIDYAHSPIVFGDANSNFSAGYRLPDNIPVRMPDAGASRLHTLGQRAGGTLILLGGPTANAETMLNLHAALQKYVENSTLFETAVALSSRANAPEQMGQLDPSDASQLGIARTTLLAVRPDGYVGLRSDRNHLDALERYASVIQTGHA